MTRTAMPTAPMGASPVRLSRVGIGTWAIGGPWTRGWGAQDDEASLAAIRRAIEGGVNWIDTAPVYGAGHAEEVIARAVADYAQEDRPLVLTKCGRVETPEGVRSIGEPGSIRAEVEASLRRLRVDRLDVLQLHWPPEDGTPLEEAWAALDALRREGKAGSLGVCNVSLAQLEALQRVARVDLVQPPLSLINRSALADVLPWAARSGAGAIVYSPMQSGILTGSFDRSRVAAMAPDDWRRSHPDFTEPRLSRHLALVDALRAIAAERGSTVSELAIAWALQQEGVTAAIVGARSPEQVDGWIGAAALVLDREARERIELALAESDAG